MAKNDLSISGDEDMAGVMLSVPSVKKIEAVE